MMEKNCDLVCTEVIDDKELQKPVMQILHPCKQQQQQQQLANFNHPPVKADCDSIILRDDRVLQNLLRNEDRYLPLTPDYFKYVQVEIKPHMRKIVADWMLDVCQELCFDQLEVFCLAMNFMDRFLAVCRISKSQLQLLGTACFFLAAKFKAIDHVSSDKLAMYTDYSITTQELKDWELLVLHKLKWELCSSTALDYLDHILPRMGLPPSVDIHSLRLKTETIITLAAKDYHFSYKPPSLIAATSIFTALRSCNFECKTKTLQNILTTDTEDLEKMRLKHHQAVLSDKILKDAKTCLQILTLASTQDMDLNCAHIMETLPDYLTGQMTKPTPVSPDTTVSKSPESSSFYHHPLVGYSQEAVFSQDPSHGVSSTSVTTSIPYTQQHLTSTPSRDQPPDFSSAVDVFSDFNSSVLQAVLSPSDSHISNSILCS